MKYPVIILLLSVILGSNAQSDSLSKKLLDCEWRIWEAQTDSVKFYTLLEKAKLYRNSKYYEEALHELERADSYGKSGTEMTQLKYEEMLNYFLSDNYMESASITFDSGETKPFEEKYYFMKLYSLAESGQFKECKEEMIELCQSCDSDAIKEINGLPTGYLYKSPEKAKHLSAFLPGLGETYSGYPLKGGLSFLLNAGFLTFAGYNFFNAYYITGVASGLFPFSKFYFGGKRLSASLAERRNGENTERLKAKYRKEINSLLKLHPGEL